MAQWNRMDEVLDFAIREEEAAAEFYTGLADQAAHGSMREVFEGFAREELGHKARLLAVKAGEVGAGVQSEVPDLKIGDYLVDIEARPDMSYQDALIVAMHKEKAAFRLYQDLAARVEDERVKDLFLSLAREEARHKLRFEVEYDDMMKED